MIEVNDQMLKEAIARVAETEDGQILLFALMDQCKWNDVVAARDEPQVTQFYAAQRAVYGALRAHISPKNLKQIEYDYKRKAGNHERATSKRTNNHNPTIQRTDRRYGPNAKPTE